jgi:hypothetical protein
VFIMINIAWLIYGGGVLLALAALARLFKG